MPVYAAWRTRPATSASFVRLKPDGPESLCGYRRMRATWPFGRWCAPPGGAIVELTEAVERNCIALCGLTVEARRKTEQRVQRCVRLLGHQRVAGIEHHRGDRCTGFCKSLSERFRGARRRHDVAPSHDQLYRAAHLGCACKAIGVGIAGREVGVEQT